MADVYEAWDARLERNVAIKRYRAAPYGTGLRRFLAEAELLGGLSHPGLLTVFDVSFDGERPFLVMRLATGGTLRDRLDTGPLDPERVAEIGAAISEVLEHIHARDIVHRDIKPSNVLFDTDGECFLADFGIAKAAGDAHLTDANEFVGTAAYLAPEQVDDSSPGPAIDVYALGLVLLECLTGEPEYQGTSVETAIARLSRRPRVSGEWGPEWKAVLTAMTADDPADRPNAASCVTLLRALEAGRTVPMAIPARRSPRIYAGVATLAAAAVAAIAFMGGPVRLPGAPVVDPAQVVHTPAAPEEQSTPDPPDAPVPDPPAVEPPTGHVAEAEDPGQGNSGKGKGKDDKERDKSGKG
jgi:eukaryotic-like serine/threonine-protein kinase